MTIPAEVAAPTGTPGAFPARVARFIDRRPAAVLPLWIATYFAVLWPAAHRPLWFDELLTYYVSRAPNAQAYLGTRFLDPTPPLSFLFARCSIAVFGDSPFAVRLPAMMGFLVASLIACWLIDKRLGGGVALASLGIFWSSWLSTYAVEARAYGLLLGFFAIAMLCWLKASEAGRWTAWHGGLTAALGAMFLTHCFSPPFAAALMIGEGVRSFVRKRIDARLWLALLLPLVILPAYLPLIKDARALLCPPEFAATLLSVPKFYLAVFAPLLPAMGAILLFWAVPWGPGLNPSLSRLARPHEAAFAVAAVLAPLFALSYSGWSGSPFWARYGIGAILGATLILAVIVAFATRRNPTASVAAAAVILLLFCVTKGGTRGLVAPYEGTTSVWTTIRPDLPFVDASGLTFLEMDHREAPGFVSRLYYLTDPAAALRYHTNIFEGLPKLRRLLPIRANVAPYRDFAAHNRQFLVLATPESPEDWLLRQLQADGARIRLLRDLKTGYRDRQLYEVTLPR